MPDDFLHLAQEIVGPRLTQMGFALAGVDSSADEGGRKRSVLYYHGPDCKIQLYHSSREGEINAMIGPLGAPDEYGLNNRSHMWHYFNEFEDESTSSLEELVEKHQVERDTFTSIPRWLEWIKDERVERYYESARGRILESYRAE